MLTREQFDTYYAHVQACTTCGQPGQGYDAPDGWQPADQQCTTAVSLLNPGVSTT